jgi:hypothetical protein
LFFVLVGIQNVILGDSMPLAQRIVTGLFYWPVYVLPTVVAAIIHLLILQWIGPRIGHRATRALAVALSPLLPLAALVTGERFETVFGHPIPLLIVLVVFALGPRASGVSQERVPA